MIVRMASDVHLRDAGYAARGSLHDIVGVFVRVSCPTEADTPRQTETNKRTHSVRAASSVKRCE